VTLESLSWGPGSNVVYYESIKRELKTRGGFGLGDLHCFLGLGWEIYITFSRCPPRSTCC
jgi:hypothetical protein